MDPLTVTCLCPTYGRFERLRDAVACYILQSWPRRRLLILNDAPEPIEAGPQAEALGIEVINNPARFATLGHKRQALLEAAETPLVAHWDDDDLYMPWHLEMLARTLMDRLGEQVYCVKPRAAWWPPTTPNWLIVSGASPTTAPTLRPETCTKKCPDGPAPTAALTPSRPPSYASIWPIFPAGSPDAEPSPPDTTLHTPPTAHPSAGHKEIRSTTTSCAVRSGRPSASGSWIMASRAGSTILDLWRLSRRWANRSRPPKPTAGVRRSSACPVTRS